MREQVLNILDNLLREELKIYGNLLVINSINDNKELFDCCLKELKICTLREQNYIDQIDCPPNLLKACTNILLINLPKTIREKYPYINIELNYQNIKLETDVECIYKRIKNILDIKTNELALQHNEKISNEKPAILGVKQVIDLEKVRTNINIIKLKHVNSYLDKPNFDEANLNYYKYILIHQTKEITDKLIAANMDIEKLPNLTETQAAKELGLSLLEYKAHKEFLILQELSEVIINLELGILDEKFFNGFGKLMLINLLNELSDATLRHYLNIFDKKYTWTNENNKKQILDIIQNVLEKKEVKMIEKTHNEPCVAIPPQIMHAFVSLIKLSEIIYDKHQRLWQLDREGKKQSEEYKQIIHELESYQTFQMEILDKLELNEDMLTVLMPIVENELPFFLKETKLNHFDGYQFSFPLKFNKKCESIKERLYNLIPNLDPKFKSLAADSKYAYYIHKNLLLSVFVKEQNNQEATKVKQLYEESYRYPMLTEELILTNFRPERIPLMDDDITMQLLNLSRQVYYYIKDEELYVIGLKFLSELFENKKINETHFGYLMANLDKILSSVSAENLSGLKDHLQMLEENNLGHKNKERTLKLNSLFENNLPYYLK